MTTKDIAAPADGWEVARKASGLCIAVATLALTLFGSYHVWAVQPVSERVDRVEIRQTQSERDRAEELQRLRGIEVVVRRIERKVDAR